ncbi:GPI mannosyltransferase 3 [Centruroides vittatus]|uniref:GPI mannosyltransferase 3 n=1 Tax=Centruroides vittatus TaxID=120091 RepID=UPI00351046F1
MKKKVHENSGLIFIILIFHSIISSFLVQTFYVPDEYWQSLEVAHRYVFGYGYLTWEWKESIRSCTYPLAIAFIYKILNVVNLDNLKCLILSPRLLQALLTGTGNYYIYKLSILHHGYRTARWTLFSLLTSWFLFYCASRTLSNTAEMAIVSYGFYLFPWFNSSVLKWKYLWFAGLSCMIRPTAVILWLPLYIWHCVQERRQIMYLLLKTMIVCACCVVAMIIFDWFCFGRFVFTPYQFMYFNWIHNVGTYYGSNSWHWYFTQGFPAVMGFQLLPFLLAFQSHQTFHYLKLILWLLTVLSFVSHKEFRFLLPVLPLSLHVSGIGLDILAQNGRKHRYLHISYRSIAMAIVILIGNFSLLIYTSLYHQRGTLDVMDYLSKLAVQNKKMNVLFLMPCHSTPFYSHIHQNITMKFLTCEPDFLNQVDYLDEADVFYGNPTFWLAEKFGSGIDVENNKIILPSHIVIFDLLFYHISEFLHYHNYDQCFKTFHTKFPHGRIGSYVKVFCHQQTID